MSDEPNTGQRLATSSRGPADDDLVVDITPTPTPTDRASSGGTADDDAGDLAGPDLVGADRAGVDATDVDAAGVGDGSAAGVDVAAAGAGTGDAVASAVGDAAAAGDEVGAAAADGAGTSDAVGDDAVAGDAVASAVGDDVGDDTDGSRAADPSAGRGRLRSAVGVVRRRWAMTLAAVSVVALLAASVVLGWANHGYDSRDATDGKFVQSARQAVLNLTSLRADSAGKDLQQIIDGASGDFRNDLSEQRDPMAQVVRQLKINATGTIVAAGVEKKSGDEATVLVASSMTFKSADDNEPKQREFRWRVRIHDDKGTMTVTQLDLVP